MNCSWRYVARVARCVVAAAAVIVWAGATNATPIGGRVVSERGEGLQAEVQLICDGVSSFALSSKSGEFTVTTTAFLDSGACRLQISAPSYRAYVISINEFMELNRVVRLEPSVEEVTVVGERIARRFATQYIGSLEALANPSVRGDPLRAVGTSQYSTDVGESTAPRLRGNPRETVGVFLDDVPVHEVTRGIDFQSWSTGAPSLNAGLVYDLEIYASNPPVFLTNPRASAVRLVPPVQRHSQSSITLMTTGLAGVHSFDRENMSIEASASWSNMAAMLKLNPSLDRAIGESRMATGSVRITGDGAFGRIGALLLADDDRGAYPISVLASRGIWHDSRQRSLAIFSWQRKISDTAIGMRLATMRSKGDGNYLSWDYRSTNAYHFLLCEASGTALGRRLTYRAGIDAEAMRLLHSGTSHRFDFLFSADFPIGSTITRDRRHTHGGAFAYATWDAVDSIVLMAGVRRHVSHPASGKESWQAGVMWENKKHNGRGVVVLGEYEGLTVPAPSDWRHPRPLQIRQAAFDYTASLPSADIGAGVFLTRIKDSASAIEIYGANVSGRWRIGDRAAARISAAQARQSEQSRGYRLHGTENMDYLLRVGFDAWIGPATIVGEYVRGSGMRYFDVVGSEVSPVDSGVHLPVFGKTMRLGTYTRLDVSVTMPARLGQMDVIGLVAVSNALNRRNPRARVYSADFATSSEVHYPGRVFLTGVILLL